MIKNVLCYLISALLIGVSTARVEAQRVGIRQGNVYFVDAAERSKQLTSGGLDSYPFLSLDHRQVVFVRATPGKMVPTGSDEQQATELYKIGVDGNNLSLLLRGKESEEVKDVLANFSFPQFSPDDQKIYFLSSAWTTSGAIHSVSLADKTVDFICAGLSLKVIPKGEYAGKLIVEQHRYFLGGGSYNWHWLLNQDGTEIGPIGEETDLFEDMYIK